jgi:galactokinase/mevalonate kinase-like predicted kinase
MYSEAQSGSGYLSSSTVVGFLINNFGSIKHSLSLSYASKVNEITNKLLQIKNQLPE